MWVLLGLGGVVLVAAICVLLFRRRTKHIDVGPVSDAWLAEQRARSRESP